MRIRKHAAGGVYAAAAAACSLNPAAAAAAAASGGGASIQSPHLCQLNQSPWDAGLSDFPPLSEYLLDEDYPPPGDLLPPPPPQPPPFWQVDPDLEVSSFSLENGSISELHQPEYSELSMNVEKWEGINQMSRESPKKQHSNINREELLQLNNPKRKPEKNNNPKRKPKKKKPAAASSTSSNPYEYYYYSGFAPWKKNRRGNSMEADKMVVEIEIGSSSYNSESLHEAGGVAVVKGDHGEVESYNSESLENDFREEEEDKRISLGQVDSFGARARARICKLEDGLDYVDVDEDEDEDDDDNVECVRRKRGRKPVKARSLKSLMDNAPLGHD